MRVLIVDDQVHVAKGVESAVNWSKLGIEEVCTAFSMHEAQTAFQNEPFDIVISDIEMPMGNGLELITWVKEEYPETECIFLTAHEDFSYAKEAVKLGAFDYLVQPVQAEELERSLALLVSRHQKKTHIDEMTLKGEYWQENSQNVKENLWRSILCGSYPQNSAQLDALAERLGVSIQPPHQYMPLLVSVMRRQVQLKDWDDELLKYSFINMLEEILFEGHGLIQVVQMDASRYVFLLPGTVKNKLDEVVLEHKLGYFILACEQYLKIRLAVYLGQYVPVAVLEDTYRHVTDLERRNVANYSKVYTLQEEGEAPKSGLQLPEIQDWTRLLEQGMGERVYDEVNAFFQRKVQAGEVDATFLAQFQNEFLQMIWHISENKGVKDLAAILTKQYFEYFLDSLTTVENMLEFIKNILTVPFAPTLTESDYKSTVDQVKQYIRSNLDRELSRNEIAETVFHNPEYLSRLFRKVTGQSLIEFITAERIQAATSYLVHTAMPVSLIASKVGYSNFSHFSKIFKKLMELSPVEYRQAHAVKPKK